MQNSFNWVFTNNSLNFDNVEENQPLFTQQQNEKKSLVFSNFKIFESLAELVNNQEPQQKFVANDFGLFLQEQLKNNNSENFLNSFKGSLMEFPMKGEQHLQSTNIKNPSQESQNILFDKNDLVRNLFNQENSQNSIQKHTNSMIFMESLTDNQFHNEVPISIQEQPPKTMKKFKKTGNSNFKQKQVVECNCKKSKCLKLYCECFAKGLICGVDCNCQDCHNSENLEELRKLVIKETIEKNPFAFKSKYKQIEKKENIVHSRGCNCSKTGCIKKYCECYNAGTGCSRLCRCVNCQNSQVELNAQDVKKYYDRVLRKRRKKSILKDCIENKDLIKKFKKQ